MPEVIVTVGSARLPSRSGPRPRTTSELPHRQVDQQPDDAAHLDAVLAVAATWPHVIEQESSISVAGARALVIADGAIIGPTEAFLDGREFCHGHAGGDVSLHACLPVDLADQAQSAGWAEPHFLVQTGALPATVVMLYAPRTIEEEQVVLDLVRSAYDFAHPAAAS